jgi:hypothetical protein
MMEATPANAGGSARLAGLYLLLSCCLSDRLQEIGRIIDVSHGIPTDFRSHVRHQARLPAVLSGLEEVND